MRALLILLSFSLLLGLAGMGTPLLAHEAKVCKKGAIWTHREGDRVWAMNFEMQQDRLVFDKNFWANEEIEPFAYKIGFELYEGDMPIAYVAAPEFCANISGICMTRIAMADGEMIESRITRIEEGEAIPYVVFSALFEQIGSYLHYGGDERGVKAAWLTKDKASYLPLMIPSVFKFERCMD